MDRRVADGRWRCKDGRVTEGGNPAFLFLEAWMTDRPLRLSIGSLAMAVLASCAPIIHAEDPSYVPGQVLVNVDGEAMQAIDRAIQDGTFPTTGLESLDAALARSGAVSAELLFKESPEDLERLKAEHPERAKRIPEGAQPPELSGTYTLTLKSGASVEDAIAALSGDPHVRYAQPNTYMSTSGQSTVTGAAEVAP
jgi:hypothetical protein